MKTSIRFLMGIFILLVFYGCPRKPDNPYDTNYDPAKWMPADLKVVQVDNTVKLTWTQDEKRIDGFKIDRNLAGAGYTNVASPSKNDISWVDPNVTGGKLHEYKLYAYAANNQSSSITGSITPLIAASVNALPITEISSISVKLNGTVNANGTSTTVSFMYKKASATDWITVDATPKILTSNTLENVNYIITNLSPGENYVFKVKAVSSAGTTESDPLTFKSSCPLGVVSSPVATSLNSSSEELDGQVNAKGVSTTVRFEYGKTTSYGQTITATPSTITDTSVVNVTATLTGLDGATKYYYKLVAENCGGLAFTAGDFTTSQACTVPIISNLSSSDITSESIKLNGQVNAKGFPTTVVFEYGETVSFGNVIDAVPSTVSGSTLTNVSAAITGLKPKTTYYWRIVADNCGGETKSEPTQIFETKCANATIVTASATPSTTSAILRGQVNANLFSTTVKFDYGETDNYGSSVAASPSPVTGNSNTSVTANVINLKPNTHYLGRLVAVNCAGGDTTKFNFITTPCTSPTSTIVSVTKKTGSSVTVTGEVNANNYNTTVMVDYGLTTSYGNSVFTTPSVVSGTSTVSVSAVITGLNLGTTYYFRISAENCGGETNSGYKAFTTSNEDEFTDKRDSKVYVRVKIGNQIWMEDNLAYLPLVSNPSAINSDANPYYYVYGYTGTSVTAAKATTNYINYGVLYNWYAARTGCPTGWHLPTDDEWKTLEQYIGMDLGIANNVGYRGTSEGSRLKAASGWYNNGNGTDSYKFAATPGGERIFFMMSFTGSPNTGLWWTNSETTSSQVWYRQLDYNSSQINRNYQTLKYLGFSVRCVQNQ
jgi:uncharacterized protein (TIGR02145 family)